MTNEYEALGKDLLHQLETAGGAIWGLSDSLEAWKAVEQFAEKLQSAAYAEGRKDEAEESGWKPIESVPKGAKGISWMRLAWGPEEDQKTGCGMRIDEKFYAAATFFCLGNKEKPFEMREIEVQPTHWMPLPDAPKDQS